MDFDINDLAQLFFEESDDFVDQMEAALLKLEQGDSDVDTLNLIFRCAHSIKGGSASLGYAEVAAFTHSLETLLDLLRGGQTGVNDEITSLLFECADHVKTLLRAARSGGEHPDSSELLSRLEVVIDCGKSSAAGVDDEGAFRREIDALLAQQEGATGDGSLYELDRLMDDPAPVHRFEAPNHERPAKDKSETHVLRISADKVDRLINLVGELVIQQSMLADAAGANPNPRLAEAIAAISQATRELQERVLSVRMLPVKQIFSKFHRVVRDVAHTCGKQVTLETSGEETELDKTIIEGLLDPITHLIRNSIDHGIELPAVREKAGKNPAGTVSLRARHESGSIILEIADDGKGLDKERILRKAVEKGLVRADEQLSDEAVYLLIYRPGFSTAETVSDLSGRGVGMDIVLETIRGLGGTISISSKPGQGTTFRLKLPITMAIVEGLTVRVGDELYVLPISNVVECLKPKQEDVHTIAGRGEILSLRSTILPVMRLQDIFGVATGARQCSEGVIVIVESGDNNIALLVDEVVGQDQVVVKSLEINYRNVEAVSGATILGDGKVALIVDIGGITNLSAASVKYAAAV